MEKEKKGSNILTIILLVALIASCGYIAYDKFIAKEEQEEVVVEQENEKKEEEQEVGIKLADDEIIVKKGACPFKKYDSNYVLTDAEKEEIMDAIESFNATYTREIIDINTLTVGDITESGYGINIKFDTIPNGSPGYVVVVKVNDKSKVIFLGSMDTAESYKSREYTLKHLCE